MLRRRDIGAVGRCGYGIRPRRRRRRLGRQGIDGWRRAGLGWRDGGSGRRSGFRSWRRWLNGSSPCRRGRCFGKRRCRFCRRDSRRHGTNGLLHRCSRGCGFRVVFVFRNRSFGARQGPNGAQAGIFGLLSLGAWAWSSLVVSRAPSEKAGREPYRHDTDHRMLEHRTPDLRSLQCCGHRSFVRFHATCPPGGQG